MQRVLVGLALISSLACVQTFDDDQARRYPCKRDAGTADCKGDWLCGVDSLCHPPSAGAYACESDDDCLGWRCGLGGKCFDPDAGVPRPCDFSDAGSHDCANGWRCGRENACHPVGAPSAYLCASDLDCESAWRCGALGRCLDPVGERAALTTVNIHVERVSPQLFDRRPDLVSFHGLPDYESMSWTDGVSMSHLFRAVSKSGLFDGGSPVIVGRATLAAAPTELAQLGASTFALHGGSITELAWDFDGGFSTFEIDAGFAAERLALADFGLYSFVVAFNPSTAARLLSAGQVVPLDMADAGLPLRDFTTNVQTFTFGRNPPNELWVLTDEGLFAQPMALVLGPPQLTGEWVPVGLTHADGGAVTPGELSLRRFYGINAVGTGDGGVFMGQVSVNDVLNLASDSPCQCPQDSTFLGVVQTSIDPQPAGTGRLRCRTASGEREYATDFSCQQLDDSRGIFSLPTSDFTTGAFYGGNYILAGAHGTLETKVPISTTGFEGPMSLEGFEADGRFLVVPADKANNLSATSYLMGLVPGVGLMSYAPVFNLFLTQPIGQVRNAPSWYLTGQGLIYDGSHLFTDTNPKPLTGAVTGLGSASLVRTLSGVSVLGVSYNGVVGFATVGASLANLQPRVPLGGITADSLALLTASPDAGYALEGYALSRGGLTAIIGYSEQAFTSTQFALPPGDWLELLGDDRQVRLGYTDGRIFTLPSRLQVSEALPSNVRALDYETLDGVDLAATDAGLLALSKNPDGGPIAQWKPVVLPPSTTDPLDLGHDFDRMKLVAGQHRVWLVNKWSTAYRITLDGGM